MDMSQVSFRHRIGVDTDVNVSGNVEKYIDVSVVDMDGNMDMHVNMDTNVWGWVHMSIHM